RAIAKECDLYADVAAVLRSQPAGDVPPFGAEIDVTPVIARKRDRAWRNHRIGHGGHRGVAGLRPSRQRRERERGKKEAATIGHYQSSFTARTTSCERTCRAAHQPV